MHVEIYKPLLIVHFLQRDRPPPFLLSFPTRRSSDLPRGHSRRGLLAMALPARDVRAGDVARQRTSAGLEPTRNGHARPARIDRKSTRLNSSHVAISYAVFCLKKKKKPSY